MLDKLQMIFWSITYVLIIISGFKSQKLKMVAMPYIAGVLNFSWEIIALSITKGTVFGHVSWLILDLFIVYISYRYLNDRKSKTIYLLSIVICVILLNYIFKLNAGMLISVFVIDLLMAVVYLLQIKQMSPHLKIQIAVTKLIGDFFAGLYYFKELKFVAAIAVVVFFCNAAYLVLCIIEYKTTDKNTYYKIEKKKAKKKKRKV